MLTALDAASDALDEAEQAFVAKVKAHRGMLLLPLLAPKVAIAS
jgi:hypothetical protein